jgi:hypothetical protein
MAIAIPIDYEPLMAALLAQVTQAPAVFQFTANLTAGSTAIAGISDASGLFDGMPLADNAGCLAELTTLAGTSPPALSQPATAAGTGVTLTQGFLKAGRRLRWWDGLTELPRVFVRHIADEDAPRPSGISDKITVCAEIWIYSKTGSDPEAVPETALNKLISAVRATLSPTPVFAGVSVQNVQTLGGAVEHCWIEGHPIISPGDAVDIASALIPVRMLVPL